MKKTDANGTLQRLSYFTFDPFQCHAPRLDLRCPARLESDGGGVLRVDRAQHAQCLPRRRLCTTRAAARARGACEATARVRCFLGVGAAGRARGAGAGGGAVPCWVQGDLLHITPLL